MGSVLRWILRTSKSTRRIESATMTSLLLLVFTVTSVTALSVRTTPDNRQLYEQKEQTLLTNGNVKISKASRADSIAKNVKESQHPEETNETAKKARKHKAIFVDYSLVPRVEKKKLYGVSSYNEIYDPATVEQRVPTTTMATAQQKYEESNIFFVKLPPMPYIFVPGLGYVSQLPKYSTSNLRPQRPPHYQQQRPPVNSFIKLPIDFVSNGKPISVYQWQKKKQPGKVPTDSPITNLHELSSAFVSNGKPTSIYQWQTKVKPVSRPDNLINSLDKGPYVFNGKPTSVYLLKADASTPVRQSIRYPDYQDVDSRYH